MTHIRSRAAKLRTLIAVLLPVLALVVCAGAASAAPIVRLVINGNDVSGLLPIEIITQDDKAFVAQLTGPVTILDVARIDALTVVTNEDPFLDYGFAVKSLTGAGLEVQFIFVSPYLGGPYNTLNTSHSGSVTDSNPIFPPGAPDGTVTVDNPEAFIHQPFVDGIDADGLNTGCVVPTGAGGSGNCPPAGLAASVPVATGAAGTFGVDVHFTLSGGDIYGPNGRVELVGAVPEPATGLLITGGVVALAALRRRWSPKRD